MTQYLAEASFWVYLIHLPFVVLTQIAITRLPVPAMGKFLLVGTTALAMALMTYQVFVRQAWLGEFLNGYRRLRKPAVARLEPVVVPRDPAIECVNCSVTSRQSIGWRTMAEEKLLWVTRQRND